MKKRSNLVLIRQEPCIVTGRSGVDPCHFPYRRSDVHDDGLLFLIPLVRDWHRLVDDYKEPYYSQVLTLARCYHRRKVVGWERRGLYLGPAWRVLEVKENLDDSIRRERPECRGVCPA